MEIKHSETIQTAAGIAFLRHGKLGGHPVIALHGSPGSHLTFNDYSESSLIGGIDLLALDRLGYGDTILSPSRSLRDWTGMVGTLLDSLDLDRVSVIGTSGGAPYALALAAELGDRIQSVAIVAGVGDFRRGDLSEGMLGLNSFMNRASSVGPWCADFVGSIVMSLSKLAPELFLKRGIKLLPLSDQHEMAIPSVHDTYIAISKTLGARRGKAFGTDFNIFNSGWVSLTSRVTCPVKWWHGELDKNVPLPHAKNIVSKLPSGELEVVKGGGHLLLRLVYGEVLSFLKSQA